MAIRSARAIAYKRGPVSVNSSLDEHRAGSGPTNESKDRVEDESGSIMGLPRILFRLCHNNIRLHVLGQDGQCWCYLLPRTSLTCHRSTEAPMKGLNGLRRG